MDTNPYPTLISSLAGLGSVARERAAGSRSMMESISAFKRSNTLIPLSLYLDHPGGKKYNQKTSIPIAS